VRRHDAAFIVPGSSPALEQTAETRRAQSINTSPRPLHLCGYIHAFLASGPNKSAVVPAQSKATGALPVDQLFRADLEGGGDFFEGGPGGSALSGFELGDVALSEAGL
jgi:hypothetical protein